MPLKDLLLCIRCLLSDNQDINTIATTLSISPEFVRAAIRGLFD